MTLAAGIITAPSARKCGVPHLQLFLEVESRQPTTRLLGGHSLGNFDMHLPVPIPAVEAIRRSLNLGGAHEHLPEADCLCGGVRFEFRWPCDDGSEEERK